MIRIITTFVLIGIAIAGFFLFTSPLYKEITTLKAQVVSYNEALSNSKALENERDKLTAKLNSISSENLDKLHKFLPDNIDNIRLILEIEKLASPYGMVLKDVKYDTTEKTTRKDTGGAGDVVQGGVAIAQKSQKDYGVWDLEFSTITNFREKTA